MVKLQMTLVSVERYIGGQTQKTRSLGNIAKGYAKLAPYSTPLDLPYPDGSSSRYSSYAAWVDAAGRALNSLSLNTYVDTQITAVWSTTEEMVG